MEQKGHRWGPQWQDLIIRQEVLEVQVWNKIERQRRDGHSKYTLKKWSGVECEWRGGVPWVLAERTDEWMKRTCGSGERMGGGSGGPTVPAGIDRGRLLHHHHGHPRQSNAAHNRPSNRCSDKRRIWSTQRFASASLTTHQSDHPNDWAILDSLAATSGDHTIRNIQGHIWKQSYMDSYEPEPWRSINIVLTDWQHKKTNIQWTKKISKTSQYISLSRWTQEALRAALDIKLGHHKATSFDQPAGWAVAGRRRKPRRATEQYVELFVFVRWL